MKEIALQTYLTIFDYIIKFVEFQVKKHITFHIEGEG